MKKFIELLNNLKQECKKQVDIVVQLEEEDNSKNYYVCDGCKFKKECRLVEWIAEEIINSGTEERDIKKIEKWMKELGL